MPFYENRDLEAFLSTHEPDFKTKVSMFIDILSGMLELHSRHIIHRDMKLKNIFVDGEKRCVVGDLGISTKSVDSARSRVCTP
jgi:serine/threonine protein kinase